MIDLKEPNEQNYTEFIAGQEYTTAVKVKEDGFKIVSHHPIFTPEEQKRKSIELTRQLYNIFNKK